MAKKKSKLSKKELALFNSHPTISELYQDTNGKYWVNKDAAIAQTKEFKIIKKQ